jgi:hypothetical protein
MANCNRRLTNTKNKMTFRSDGLSMLRSRDYQRSTLQQQKTHYATVVWAVCETNANPCYICSSRNALSG